MQEENQIQECLLILHQLGYFDSIIGELKEEAFNVLAHESEHNAINRIRELRAKINLLESLNAEAGSHGQQETYHE